jgi:hypothetical protein
MPNDAADRWLGKCVAHTSAPLSQWRSRKFRRVVLANAGSLSACMIHPGSRHCTGLWIQSPVMTACAFAEDKWMLT